MALIGIDLGTTNSLSGICRDGKTILIPNAFGSVLTPSAVSLDDEGTICVGAVARERLVSHPDSSVASFKRLMGAGKLVILDEQRFTPQELSSFVLRQLKEDAERFLGEEVTEAVISVPAYFNDNQRYATKEAGELAGLKVERLVNEPSAAALAASRLSGEEEGSYLVFDLGGGTLDVSVVDYFDNVIEIIAVRGDNRLGGDDFDEIIARQFCAEQSLEYESLTPSQEASLLRLAEKCKRDLTINRQGVLTFETDGRTGQLILTNVRLAELCHTLFDRIARVITDVLKDSQRTIRDVDEIILVGGSAKMPVITLFLQTFLGKVPYLAGAPDEMVAMGAGIYAGMKERRQEIRDLVLTDICPFTLGTGVINYTDLSKEVMSPIIERNSILPSSKVGYYTNAYDNQKHLDVSVYQGESYYCEDNIKLGELKLDILPVKQGESQIEVRFTYDINGILEVEATDRQRSLTKRKVLTSEHTRLTPEELEIRLRELMAYKLMPAGGIRAKLTFARGERLFRELMGGKRKIVADVMNRLQEAIKEQSDQGIANALREAEETFDRLEERG